MIGLLLACATNDPQVVAHRALGIAESDAENQPDNIIAALKAGYGAELDLRLDGDGCEGEPRRAAAEGCFDLGHTTPNGHTFAEVIAGLAALEVPAGAPPMVLDVVNDPDRAVSEQLLDYLALAWPANASTLPVIVQSSSIDSVAMVSARREIHSFEFELQLGVTYFVDPELTVPDYVDVVIANVGELPSVPMPVPVAVFGVASHSSWKQAIYSSSDVRWVITDFPSRIEGFTTE